MNFSFARNNVVKRLRIECEICIHVLPPVAHTLIHAFVFKKIFTNPVGSLKMVATAAAAVTVANEINTSPSKLVFEEDIQK